MKLRIGILSIFMLVLAACGEKLESNSLSSESFNGSDETELFLDSDQAVTQNSLRGITITNPSENQPLSFNSSRGRHIARIMEVRFQKASEFIGTDAFTVTYWHCENPTSFLRYTTNGQSVLTSSRRPSLDDPFFNEIQDHCGSRRGLITLSFFKNNESLNQLEARFFDDSNILAFAIENVSLFKANEARVTNSVLIPNIEIEEPGIIINTQDLRDPTTAAVECSGDTSNRDISIRNNGRALTICVTNVRQLNLLRGNIVSGRHASCDPIFNLNNAAGWDSHFNDIAWNEGSANSLFPRGRRLWYTACFASPEIGGTIRKSFQLQ